MNCLTMPRARKNFLLDERVLKALDDAAKNAGCKSANAFVEQLLFNTLKMSGNLGADAKPLPDGRGGKRENAGKKKQSPTDEESISTDKESLSNLEPTDDDCL
jgi:hypothetical protein